MRFSNLNKLTAWFHNFTLNTFVWSDLFCHDPTNGCSAKSALSSVEKVKQGMWKGSVAKHYSSWKKTAEAKYRFSITMHHKIWHANGWTNWFWTFVWSEGQSKANMRVYFFSFFLSIHLLTPSSPARPTLTPNMLSTSMHHDTNWNEPRSEECGCTMLQCPAFYFLKIETSWIELYE